MTEISFSALDSTLNNSASFFSTLPLRSLPAPDPQALDIQAYVWFSCPSCSLPSALCACARREEVL
jgi:hypothetical protein